MIMMVQDGGFLSRESLFLAFAVLSLVLVGCGAEHLGSGETGWFESEPVPLDGSMKLEYENMHRLVRREPAIARYLNPVRRAVYHHRHRHPVDPLLVMALIKHESDFEARTISSMGAAGPLQIMPSTARHLDLQPVYESEKHKQGLQWRRRANRSLSRAVDFMKEEEFMNMRRHLRSWRRLRSRSRKALQNYRANLKRLIQGKTDEELRDVDQRFVRELAVDRGIRYLAEMLDRRRGDVREALAAYNAGPGSVRRYQGIPPYNETVVYQNRIMNTFKQYRRWVTRPLRATRPSATQTSRESG